MFRFVFGVVGHVPLGLIVMGATMWASSWTDMLLLFANEERGAPADDRSKT